MDAGRVGGCRGSSLAARQQRCRRGGERPAELGTLALVEPAEDAAERGGHGGVQVEHARLLDAVGEEANDSH
jgi:hypothetical protein